MPPDPEAFSFYILFILLSWCFIMQYRKQYKIAYKILLVYSWWIIIREKARDAGGTL
jgi:hypothetical protein